VEELLENLPNSKREVYKAFQFNNKSVEEIATERGIAFSTVFAYIEEAILNGLPINFERMGITLERIDYLEKLIRKPPINSSKALKNYFYSKNLSIF
jgi:hypothetical protein